MTSATRCTYNTRLAGWMSGLVATATFSFLHTAYDRLPIVVPISFEGGNPLHFAAKTPELVYLPFGLQLAMGAVFAAVVAVVLGVRRAGDASASDLQRRVVAQHTAEGVALLAAIWIGFQSINAWRLTELWRRTFDPFIELYVFGLITAFAFSVVIGVRVVAKVHESGAGVSTLRAPVLEGRPRASTAVLAALLALGIAAPLALLLLVWDLLHLYA